MSEGIYTLFTSYTEHRRSGSDGLVCDLLLLVVSSVDKQPVVGLLYVRLKFEIVDSGWKLSLDLAFFTLMVGMAMAGQFHHLIRCLVLSVSSRGLFCASYLWWTLLLDCVVI